MEDLDNRSSIHPVVLDKDVSIKKNHDIVSMLMVENIIEEATQDNKDNKVHKS
jgi:hypothetical protein